MTNTKDKNSVRRVVLVHGTPPGPHASHQAGSVPEHALSMGQWGLVCFLLSEVALFSTLIVTYVFYLGQDSVGPTPKEALSLSLVFITTACLLTSSLTIHLAERMLEHGQQRKFLLLWSTTIALGILFLFGTAYEWYGLIVDHHLTISRNLFGTTFFTLVGLHALHVTGGVIIMLIVLALALQQQITSRNRGGVGLVSWYWHFVDVVWIVVFIVVYLVGR